MSQPVCTVHASYANRSLPGQHNRNKILLETKYSKKKKTPLLQQLASQLVRE